MSSQTNPLPALEAAELAIVLKPIYSFLTALQQPGANIQTVIQGVNMVELEEAAQLPAIESVGLGTIASTLQSKLTAWEASLANPAPQPAPASLLSSENGSSVL